MALHGICNRLSRPARGGAWPFWLVAAAFAAAFGTYLWLFPMAHDDFWFATYLYDYREGLTSNPWPAILKTWHWHWMYDNTRLGNMLFMPLLTQPRAVYLPIDIAALLLWCVLTSRLAGTGTRSACVAMGVVAMVSALPMWRAEFSSVCFRANYAWASPVMLWAMILFFRPGRRRVWTMALGGYLCGMWHEAFGLTFIAAAVAMMILWRRDYLDRRRLWLVGGAVAGVLVLLVAPCTWNRVEYFNEKFAFVTSQFVTAIPAALIYGAAVAAAMIFPRLRLAVSWRLIAFLGVGTLAGIPLLIWTGFSRGGWPMVVCAIVGICHVAATAVRVYPATRRWGRAAACVGFAVMVLKVSFGIKGALRVLPMVETSVEAITSYNPDGDNPYYLFIPMISPFDGPAEAVVWPHYVDLQVQNFSAGNICNYYRLPWWAHFIPDTLKYATDTTGEAVPGTPGLRRIGQQYYMPLDPDAPKSMYDLMPAQVKHGPLTRTYMMHVYGFESQADGRTYAWVTPLITNRLIVPWGIDEMRLAWPPHHPD